MDDKKWEKWATLGGPIFVILGIVGAILQGALPMSGDTNDEVLDWLVDKESSIRTAAFLGALSLIAFAFWFGSLWRRMSKAENNNHRLSVVAFAGFIGGGAMFAASTAILSTMALRVDELDAVNTRFFWVLATVLLSMAGAFIFTHLAAVNLLALRTKFLPKWVALLGFLPALLFLISISGTMTDKDFTMITGGIGFILWSIWILATTFHMWKTAD